MKSLVAFLTASFIALSSQAIRVVGDAGGEAELKLLKQFESLPVWFYFCSQNPKVCFSEAALTAKILQKFEKKISTVQTIEFMNQKDLSKSSRKSLTVSYESLYIDDQTPKSDLEIFQVLVANAVFGTQTKPETEKTGVRLASEITNHPKLETAYLKGPESDFVVAVGGSGTQNLHEELNQLLNSSYKILSVTSTGYLIQKLSDGHSYEVILQDQKGRFDLKVFFKESGV